MSDIRHRPILVNEVLDLLKVRAGGVYADLTFGEGGHSEPILQAGVHSLLAQDQDLQALERYRACGLERANLRLILRHATISEFASDPENFDKFDGIFADLGVSTYQLLHSGRGFTFQKPEPLDMRMDVERGIPLSERLAEVEADELADIIYQTTELRQSRVLARRILQAFHAGELKTSMDLAAVAESVLAGPPHKQKRSHPATPLFLGMRMWVNDEYDQVAQGVPALFRCLKPGGRLGVLTFHSVEDRLVKHAFQRMAGLRAEQAQTIFYATEASEKAPAELITRKPVTPGDEEISRNPRARSTKFRVIERRC